jgi:amidase
VLIWRQHCTTTLSPSFEALIMSPSVQDIAAKAQQRVLDSIPAKWKLSSEAQIPSNVMGVPKTCGLLTPRQINITEQTATELLDKMANGSLSSVEVTEAFLTRAAIAHQLVLTFFLRAYESRLMNM